MCVSPSMFPQCLCKVPPIVQLTIHTAVLLHTFCLTLNNYHKIIIILKENSKTHSLLQQLHKHCRMCALNSKQYETDLRTHLQPLLSTITKMSYCWVYGICTYKKKKSFWKALNISPSSEWCYVKTEEEKLKLHVGED